MEVQLVRLFDVPDLDDDAGALVEKVDQLVVELVDLLPQFLNFLIGHYGDNLPEEDLKL
jgi:hypothetical protein